ncbi:hypothetical protein ACROYT_G025059 [Oculina patagonica]
MIQVLFTSVFYLVLLAILGLFALLVRLIGTTPDPEPDTTPPRPSTPPPRQEKFLLALKDKPENNPIEDEVAQELSVPENFPELENNYEEQDTNLVSLVKASSEAEPEAVISEQHPSARPNNMKRLIVSPLTLFLVGDNARTRERSSEKWVQTKLWRKAQKID